MDGLFDFARLFAGWAVCAAISSAPLCLIVGMITFGGQRWLSARMRFALWSLVLVRMVLPVSLETPFGLGMMTNYLPVKTATREVAIGTMEMSLPNFSEPLNENLELANAPTAAAYDLRDLRWEYLVGVSAVFGIASVSLLLAIWFLVTSLRTSHRIRRGVIPDVCTWNELLKKGCQEFGIRVPVQFRTLPDWKTPATMGFLRPIIILPDDAATLTETELQHVLWHELAHIKRGDSAWSYLWIAARCLQWWNPCFWWTQYCWLAERELACDAMVMQRLGSSTGTDYGRTLIHFLERLSPSASSSQSIPLPGLVMLLGDQATIRRRLKALAHPLAIETIWGRWSSLGLLTILAVMGLTDAATSKTVSPQSNLVRVPSETVWQFSPEVTDEAEAVQLPTITCNYDISVALQRLQQSDPNANAEIDIAGMIQENGPIFPWINGKPQADHCQMFGNALIVRATHPQHQRIQQLLSHWAEFGQQQICTEIRLCSTGMELSDFMPGAGGQIISPSPLGDTDLLKGSQSSHEIKHLHSGLSYVRSLTPAELATTVRRLQEDPRSSMTFAPKVTTFSLSTGCISDVKKRPFVTGARTTNDGTREPQISTALEGVQIEWTPTVVDAQGSVRLDLHIRLSQIHDVETFRTKVADQSEEICIQIPHVTEWNLKNTFTLTDGKTVVVSPLRRDKQGNLLLFLLTPRLIETP